MFAETEKLQPGDRLVATFWKDGRQVRIVDRPEPRPQRVEWP